MRALRGLALLVLAAVLTATAHAQGARLGPGLAATLDGMQATDQITVVVTFDGDQPVTAAQIQQVEALGITQGLYFHALPMMGVLATPAQVYALAQLDGVRTLWPNDPLTYFNEDARDLTGVNRLRRDASLRTDRGVPFSGDGVAVEINDSGVDGTHPDLDLVQNVQGLTNLNAVDGMLPVSYTEDMPNTDLGSGHGTHVAGTVGGTGVQSDGKYAGVAPGADLVGYGSGAVLFILDGLGGFDYALTHQLDADHAPIRVITNSWGSTGEFDPDDPIVVASYLAYQRSIVTLFAAGNSGPGEDTNNRYAQAPWIIGVGAGRKDGTLEDFSSRGQKGEGGVFTTYDNVEWTYANEPTVVAPGVDIVSTRTLTGALPPLAAEQDANELGTLAAYYTIMSGTSMATPHVAGIVALILEANPQLDPLEVKQLLQQTATNMPGREAWEVGAGYVNAYDAVVQALGLRSDFGAILTVDHAFNATADLTTSHAPFSIDYNPQPALSADGNQITVDVPPGLAVLAVNIDADGVAGETGNAIYPVLIEPDGTEHASGTTLLFPLEFNRTEIVSNPAPGTWTIEIRGIQEDTGENVVSVPEQVEGEVVFQLSNGFSGLSDVPGGHPAQGAIQAAVSDHLVDGFADGTFHPDDALTRGDLAQYLVFGAGIRQFLPIDGNASFGDVPATLAPYVEAVTAKGAALKDRQQFDGGVVRAGGTFAPAGAVSRADLAYSLVQSLGLQETAQSFTGTLTVNFNGHMIPIDDAGDVPAELRGYVQLALDLGLLNAYFSLEQGPFDLEPVVKAAFRPAASITRGEYAVAAVRYLNTYR